MPALVAAGLPVTHPAIRRAVGWLESVQNDDGGWGEDLRSYREEKWIGHGASTASQTAWALLALLATGRRDSRAVQRGVSWLTGTQQADGSWDEPYFTGTGFPGTSPSTTTSTARCSRSPRSGGTCTASRSPTVRPPARRPDGRRPGTAGPTAPLLIACALGIEQFALRSGRGRAGTAPGPVTVLRTGMGPRAAEEAVTRELGKDRVPGTAVLASGFCAGLLPGMHPGTWWSPTRPGKPGTPRSAPVRACSPRPWAGRCPAAPSTPVR